MQAPPLPPAFPSPCPPAPEWHPPGFSALQRPKGPLPRWACSGEGRVSMAQSPCEAGFLLREQGKAGEGFVNGRVKAGPAFWKRPSGRAGVYHESVAFPPLSFVLLASVSLSRAPA